MAGMKEAQDVLTLLRAYLPSAALGAALELGLFWRLSEGPLPVEDLDLGAAIDALSAILKDKLAGLSPAIPAQARLDEAPALRQRLAGIFSTANDAKQLPVADTAELDERDGELYLRMRDLYEAGRAAVRAGLIDRPLSNFRFTHLRHGRSRANDPAVDPAPVQ